MGIPVLILGASGSGKSTSLRNFTDKEVEIFNVASKPLPFKAKLHRVEAADYRKIGLVLAEPKLKRYVIDDSQYLMAFELFDKAKETGYGKFTDVALHFRNMLKYIVEQVPPDVVVYLLHHVEETEKGTVKAKTSGKMLDNQLTIEGLFSVVLLAKTDGKSYYFETQSDGLTPSKSPMGMFEKEIDNDLKFVDTIIREYWELGELK